MYDLIGEYEDSLSMTREMKRKVEEKIFELKSIVANEDMPFEERAAASDQLLLEEQDKTIISGMESDLVFAINWMLTSRRPGSRRGIERRSSAQLTKLIDPCLLQNIYPGEPDEYSWDDEASQGEFLKELKVKEVLAVLTKKQKDMFVMIRGQGLTIGETAKQLNLSRQAVRQALIRAERKIAEYIVNLKGAGEYESCSADKRH